MFEGLFQPMHLLTLFFMLAFIGGIWLLIRTLIRSGRRQR